MKTERNLYSFEEKRLARLLQQAAMAYIRREHGRTQILLGDAIELVEWSNRPDWALAEAFLEQWDSNVREELNGRSHTTAPAAWIHLAQELASLLETQGDWIAHLKARWRVEDGRLGSRRRFAYAAMGLSALGLGALVLGTTAHGLLNGEISLAGYAFLLIAGRILGAALMVEHGFYWGRRALRGKSDDPEAVFISSPGGLKLLS